MFEIICLVLGCIFSFVSGVGAAVLCAKDMTRDAFLKDTDSITNFKIVLMIIVSVFLFILAGTSDEVDTKVQEKHCERLTGEVCVTTTIPERELKKEER